MSSNNIADYVTNAMTCIPSGWRPLHLVVNTRYLRPDNMSGVHVVAIDTTRHRLTSAPLGLFQGSASEVAEALEDGLSARVADRTVLVGCLHPAEPEDEAVDLRRLPILPIEFKESDRLPDGCEAILLTLG